MADDLPKKPPPPHVLAKKRPPPMPPPMLWLGITGLPVKTRPFFYRNLLYDTFTDNHGDSATSSGGLESRPPTPPSEGDSDDSGRDLAIAVAVARWRRLTLAKLDEKAKPAKTVVKAIPVAALKKSI